MIIQKNETIKADIDFPPIRGTLHAGTSLKGESVLETMTALSIVQGAQ
jgi:hypothetical protein